MWAQQSAIMWMYRSGRKPCFDCDRPRAASYEAAFVRSGGVLGSENFGYFGCWPGLFRSQSDANRFI